MYSSFELHFARADIATIPPELIGLRPSANPDVGDMMVDVSPWTKGVAYILAKDFEFATYAFSVGIFTRSPDDLSTSRAYLAAIFDWASAVLAAIDDDALFVVCDAERGRGTTEICRLIAGTFHYPASGTALTDAFRTLALTHRDAMTVAGRRAPHPPT